MAVNANTGEFAWSVPLGITEELPPEKQKTGRMNLGGPIVTAGGLVFIGASNDRRFRAFDSKTGKELWVARLDYSAISVPMTYRGRNGRQYVAVIATGGSGITDPNPSNTNRWLSLHCRDAARRTPRPSRPPDDRGWRACRIAGCES